MNHLKRTPEERAALLAHLRENYVYEPEGAIRFTGRDKPRQGNNLKPPNRNKKPYLSVKIEVGGVKHLICYHQAVWLVCKGRWPEGQLDHLNGNQRDNRIENLRECDSRENKLNSLLPWRPNKVTGVPGVHLRKDGRFETLLRGKIYRFRNPHEAFYWAMMTGKKYKQE